MRERDRDRQTDRRVCLKGGEEVRERGLGGGGCLKRGEGVLVSVVGLQHVNSCWIITCRQPYTITTGRGRLERERGTQRCVYPFVSQPSAIRESSFGGSPGQSSLSGESRTEFPQVVGSPGQSFLR